MKRKYVLFFFLFIPFSITNAKNRRFVFDTVAVPKYYNFNIVNGDNLVSMRQMNQSYLSAFRISTDFLNKNFTGKKIFIRIPIEIFMLGIGYLITHEEGHRSVLTNLKIGSTSDPFPAFYTGFGYVNGVSDKTLIDLRDNDLPNYLRLHIGGLESDYSIVDQEENLIALGEEDYDIIKYDLIFKKAGINFYFLTSTKEFSPLFEDLESNLPKNENQQDIVGHDIIGFIKNLYRPNSSFKRYNTTKDLLDEEYNFLKNQIYMSFLNYISPSMYGIPYFKLSKNLKFNFSFGYMLSPFGGFIDQKLYFNINNKVKLQGYFREYHNKDNWFFATGVKLINFRLFNNKMFINSGIHFWDQPQKLDFRTSKGEFGFGCESNIAYRIIKSSKTGLGFLLNTGFTYKTYGFLPEFASLGEDFKLEFGVGFSF